jgi:hypothetical protein
VEMIAELKNMGIEIALEENMLRLTPEEKITPDLLSRIKANKKDIVRALKQNRPDIPNGSFYLIDGKVQPVPAADIPLIQGLPYGLLKTLPPTALYIYSRLLNDHIWLITSPELVDRLRDSGKTVYMLEEIARLFEQNLTDPESIKALHIVKREIPGSYIQ